MRFQATIIPEGVSQAVHECQPRYVRRAMLMLPRFPDISGVLTRVVRIHFRHARWRRPSLEASPLPLSHSSSLYVAMSGDENSKPVNVDPRWCVMVFLIQ